MVAGRFTVADIGLFAYVHVAEEGGFKLGDYPSVVRWIERVASERGILSMTSNPEAGGGQDGRGMPGGVLASAAS
jgi:glutathione S-transferase